MKSENQLDQLLEKSSKIDAPDAAILLTARDVVTTEVEATAARTAKMVQMRRRHRRLTVGVAAAAIAGLIAVPLLSQGKSLSTPSATTPHHQAPALQEQFTTVAQVTRAAESASRSISPTAAPYWKVVTSWKCPGVTASGTCTGTIWNGIDGPGVSVDANGDKMRVPQATVKIGGRSIPWKDANARSWTDAQIATMVAENGPSEGPGRAPSGYYVFKNAIGLLSFTPASSTIRKQLWQILARVPDATLEGRATDAVGRTGWKITWSNASWGSESIIVDTATGMPLEESDQAGTNSLGARTLNVTTIVSTGPASAAPIVPSQKEIQRQLAAEVRACGVTAQMQNSANKMARRTGKLPSFSPSIQACVDKIQVP